VLANDAWEGEGADGHVADSWSRMAAPAAASASPGRDAVEAEGAGVLRSASSASSPPPLAFGDAARLHSLRTKPHFNGALGMVAGEMDLATLHSPGTRIPAQA
jgi:hypothetical protein